MELQIVKNNQAQVAWERDPSEYAEGVTLTHLKPWRESRTRRVEYKGTASALIKAGLCREDQLPGQPSTGVNSITFAPDGTRKRAGGSPVQAGTMSIYRSGLSFKCHVHVEITSDERMLLENEYDKSESQNLHAATTSKPNDLEGLTPHERRMRTYEEMSDEEIDHYIEKIREWFLSDERAANEVKSARRAKIISSKGVVIYPKIWQQA